jgi:hypothetical protein
MSTMPKMTREEWDRVVTQMIGGGAQLTETEKEVLVNYLATTYSRSRGDQFLASEPLGLVAAR